MHIEIVFDFNGAFNDLGYHPLVAVPYAMTARYAQSTDSINGFFVDKDVPANADFTDDQQLSISNDTLLLEDGGFVDLSVYKDTDQQQLDSVVFDPISSNLTIYLQNGGSKTVNLSGLSNNEVIGVSFSKSHFKHCFFRWFIFRY